MASAPDDDQAKEPMHWKAFWHRYQSMYEQSNYCALKDATERVNELEAVKKDLAVLDQLPAYYFNPFFFQTRQQAAPAHAHADHPRAS